MSDETPVPWLENEQAQIVLRRLQDGPASTLDLQQAPIVHAARQIWELRHFYGWRIKTGRLPNRVALYTLLGRADDPTTTRVNELRRERVAVPAFGDPEAIHDIRRAEIKRRRR